MKIRIKTADLGVILQDLHGPLRRLNASPLKAVDVHRFQEEGLAVHEHLGSLHLHTGGDHAVMPEKDLL